MSKTRNLSDLLDANGDVKSGALDNVPASNDASALTTGTLPNARLSSVPNSALANSSITINGSATALGGSVTVSSDLVNDASPELGANLSSNGNDINFGDNDKAQFGASNDLQIYHDTTAGNSYIKDNGTGYLILQASTNLQLRGVNNEVFLNAGENGSVDLYHDNSKKFETTSNGVKISSGRMFASGGETISVGFWAKWRGTGTVTLEDDYNVSSIGDVSSGQYDVNFTINCNNNDYAVAGTSTATNHSGWNVKSTGIQNAPTNLSTGSVRIVTENTDSYYVSCIGFGDW